MPGRQTVVTHTSRLKTPIPVDAARALKYIGKVSVGLVGPRTRNNYGTIEPAQIVLVSEEDYKYLIVKKEFQVVDPAEEKKVNRRARRARKLSLGVKDNG